MSGLLFLLLNFCKKKKKKNLSLSQPPRKSVIFDWSPECKSAFAKLRRMLIDSTTVTLLTDTDPNILMGMLVTMELGQVCHRFQMWKRKLSIMPVEISTLLRYSQRGARCCQIPETFDTLTLRKAIHGLIK